MNTLANQFESETPRNDCEALLVAPGGRSADGDGEEQYAVGLCGPATIRIEPVLEVELESGGAP